MSAETTHSTTIEILGRLDGGDPQSFGELTIEVPVRFDGTNLVLDYSVFVRELAQGFREAADAVEHVGPDDILSRIGPQP